MSRLVQYLKSVSGLCQGVVSRSSWLSGAYLGAIGRVTKAAPDATWKAYLANGLNSTRWPAVEFPAMPVALSERLPPISIVPHLGEFDFQALLYRKLPYEASVFKWLENRTYESVIEIGANVGVFTLFFSRLQPNAQIYSFEPSRTAYARLLENLSANLSSNVHTFNCAVSGQTGFVDFFEPAGHLTNGSLRSSFSEMFSKSIATNRVLAIGAAELESLLVTGRSLVKIDAEGAEGEILAAMEPLIRKFKPDLLVEALPTTADELNALTYLRESGYLPYLLTDSGPKRRDRIVPSEQFRDYALVAE